MSSGRRTADAEQARTAAGLRHIPSVDGFRFYSLLGVVVLHLLIGTGVFDNASHAGQVALWFLLGNVIDGFFIISGFGLLLGVAATGGRIENVGSWAIRRAARILPAYWLCLAVILLAIAIWPQPASGVEFPGIREVGVHLVGVQHVMRLFDGGFPIGFNVAFAVWMLSVIIAFYVVFPFIARSYYKHPFVGLAVAAAITLAWREAALHEPAFFDGIEGGPTPAFITQFMVTDQLPGWIFSFALGMTGAWLYHRYRVGDTTAGGVSARTGLGIAAVGLVAFGFFGYLYASSAADYNPSIGDVATRAHEPLLTEAFSASRALLMAGIVLVPFWLQAPFTNRPVLVGAELSYAVYLIHMPIGFYIGGVLLGLPADGSVGDTAVWFAVVLTLSFAYAFFSNRFVERPAIRWARHSTEPDADQSGAATPGLTSTAP